MRRTDIPKESNGEEHLVDLNQAYYKNGIACHLGGLTLSNANTQNRFPCTYVLS